MKSALRTIFSFLFLVLSILPVESLSAATYSDIFGVNSWDWTTELATAWSQSGIKRYRVMCDWSGMETSDNVYNWNASDNMLGALDLAKATPGVKVSLCTFNSPGWARSDWSNIYSCAAKNAEFCVALLDYWEANAPGCVESIEIGNEELCGNKWDGIAPTMGTEDRDPSQGYYEHLKACYTAIKAKYPNVIVVMTSVWSGAFHIVDDVYQLGCKGYFDRMNIHSYPINSEDRVGRMDPVKADPSSFNNGIEWNYATAISYMRYLARENGEPAKNIWNTEFGFRFGIRDPMGPPPDFPTYEIVKSSYMQYTMDTSRKSGFIDKMYMYVGYHTGYPSNMDTMALLYGTPLVKTTAYYMYGTEYAKYPAWSDTMAVPLNIAKGGTRSITMVNAGFENGTTSNWEGNGGGIILSTISHSGSFSGRQSDANYIRSAFYPADEGHLYEISAWVKISAANWRAFMMSLCSISRRTDGGVIYSGPANYFGLVDTGKYPNGWRRVRFMILCQGAELAAEFGGAGVGTFYVDDLEIKPLYLDSEPVLALSSSRLNFGEVTLGGGPMQMSVMLSNAHLGTLAGSITTDQPWISVDRATFSGAATVNVAVNPADIPSTGDFTGNVIIDSNGGRASISVTLTATCVLVKPNPVTVTNLEKNGITFFGDGLVPGETSVKICTLSGDVIASLSAGKSDTINWKQGGVAPGIYLYLYESPKEKGIAKFTVVR